MAQKEHRARILPTPGPQQAAPRLHQLDRLFTKGVGQLDLDIADKTVVSQTVGGEQHSVIVHERTVLEVAAGIPRIGLQQIVTEKEPGGFEQLCDTRRARPVHASHDEHRRSWGRGGVWRE